MECTARQYAVGGLKPHRVSPDPVTAQCTVCGSRYMTVPPPRPTSPPQLLIPFFLVQPPPAPLYAPFLLPPQPPPPPPPWVASSTRTFYASFPAPARCFASDWLLIVYPVCPPTWRQEEARNQEIDLLNSDPFDMVRPRRRLKAQTVNPKPEILNPTPYTVKPIP